MRQENRVLVGTSQNARQVYLAATRLPRNRRNHRQQSTPVLNRRSVGMNDDAFPRSHGCVSYVKRILRPEFAISGSAPLGASSIQRTFRLGGARARRAKGRASRLHSTVKTTRPGTPEKWGLGCLPAHTTRQLLAKIRKIMTQISINVVVTNCAKTDGKGFLPWSGEGDAPGRSIHFGRSWADSTPFTESQVDWAFS